MFTLNLDGTVVSFREKAQELPENNLPNNISFVFTKLLFLNQTARYLHGEDLNHTIKKAVL